MLAHEVDGIVRIRSDFARRVSLGNAEVQVLVHGIDANRGPHHPGLCPGSGGQWAARRGAESQPIVGRAGHGSGSALVQRGRTTAIIFSCPA